MRRALTILATLAILGALLLAASFFIPGPLSRASVARSIESANPNLSTECTPLDPEAREYWRCALADSSSNAGAYIVEADGHCWEARETGSGLSEAPDRSRGCVKLINWLRPVSRVIAVLFPEPEVPSISVSSGGQRSVEIEASAYRPRFGSLSLDPFASAGRLGIDKYGADLSIETPEGASALTASPLMCKAPRIEAERAAERWNVALAKFEGGRECRRILIEVEYGSGSFLGQAHYFLSLGVGKR